jgi:Flp pilus assembly protein TadB
MTFNPRQTPNERAAQERPPPTRLDQYEQALSRYELVDMVWDLSRWVFALGICMLLFYIFGDTMTVTEWIGVALFMVLPVPLYYWRRRTKLRLNAMKQELEARLNDE